MVLRSVAMECGSYRPHEGRTTARTEVLRECGRGESQFAGTGRGKEPAPLGDEEPVRGDAEYSVMVETAPAAAFTVPQPEFLLQFLVIPLKDPAVLRCLDEFPQLGVGRKCGEPVFGRLRFTSGPLPEQPFLWMSLGLAGITMRRTDTDCGKPGSQSVFGALTPGHGSRCGLEEGLREMLHRDRLMLVIASQQFPRTPLPLQGLGDSTTRCLFITQQYQTADYIETCSR